MDEPTATLTPGETERLFALIAQLRADGVTIVYISHKLDEVERVTDEVIVMRDGRFVARAPTADAHAPADGEPDGRARTGRPLSAARRRRSRRRAGAAGARLQRARLGAGRRASRCAPARSSASPAWSARAAPSCSKACWACARAARGASRSTGQRVRICATRATPPTHGLTYLSEDRKGKGLHVHFGLRENLTLMALRALRRSPGCKPDAERAALAEAVKDYGIRTGSLDVTASSLSGGNQQKLALAKVLQPRAEGGGARRADARRRRRRQARHLFPDPAAGPRRAAP